MSTDIDVDMSTEDDINEELQKDEKTSKKTLQCTEDVTEERRFSILELEDMKEKFMMFDDDGGGGLTATELEKCKNLKYFI